MSTVAEIKTAFQQLSEREQWKLAEWIQEKLESFETLDADGAKGREPVSSVVSIVRRVRRERREGHRRPDSSGRRRFGFGQGGFKHAKQFFLLPHDRFRRGEFLFQRQPGVRLGQAQDALAVDELDEVELDLVAVNHGISVHEIRGIATAG